MGDIAMTFLTHKLRVLLTLVAAGGLSTGTLLADGKMEPPVPVRTVAPEVPSALSRSGGSGLVTVNFLVDEQGAVQDAKVEKTSDPTLDEPALKAVKKWKFKPAKKDGTAVAIRVSIPIKFEVE